MVAIGMDKPNAHGGPAAVSEPDGDVPMSGGEDCVPLSALAMPDADNGDQMANPEPGDKVSYTVDGAVTRIEGGNAYVKRDAVNGQPVGSPESTSDGDQLDEDGDERGALGDMAGQMGGMS